MYNKNNLSRFVLITPKEVIKHAPTKHTLDERMIESSIIIAEERFIRPELGDTLYDAICNQKNKSVTTGNATTLSTQSGLTLVAGDIVNASEYITTSAYLTLWNSLLWKLIAECVIVATYPEGFVQLGSEGTLHNNPPAGLQVTSGFVTPLLSSMKWSIDKKIKDRIGPLLNALHIHICKNISNFVGYERDCSDCKSGKDKEKWTGLATDIYEDDENCKCSPGGF